MNYSANGKYVLAFTRDGFKHLAQYEITGKTTPIRVQSTLRPCEDMVPREMFLKFLVKELQNGGTVTRYKAPKSVLKRVR